ncbi:MAG TPA: insulinase family protein [Longimicrobiales bacterium]|nr:insulinase family protein [Longimicrobiales bacterium]
MNEWPRRLACRLARTTVFAILAVAAPGLQSSQPVYGQVPSERLPTDPAVTVGELPNGLRYYIRQNSRPEQRAELRLVVNAGSILEDDDQLGLAHFAEHMAFNGTRNFPKSELVRYLESIGMRFGADLNAYTSFDETVYMLQVPTDSAAPMRTAMQILEDWAHGIAFDPAEIEKERGVVLEEWRLGQGAGERLRKQYFPTLFHGSRYADRLPIGTPEVLQSFDPARLVQFYRDWYRPDLMAVIAVGDFQAGDVEALIREHFGRIPAPDTPRERRTWNVPGHAETLVAIATDPEATGTQVELARKLPPRDHGTLESYRRTLEGQLYTRMLNARFSEIAQKPEPPFIGAGSSYGSFIRGGEMHSLGAAVETGGLETGLAALLTEAQRVLRHGFTAPELEREKTNLLRAMERAHAERERTESARFAAEYVRAFLQGEAIPGIEAEFALVQQLLPTIGVADVNALARTLIGEGDRVIIVTAPERADASIPTAETLLAVVEQVQGMPVAAYEDVTLDGPLIAESPTAGRIVAERPVPGLDATLLELSNGAQVYLKRTDFQHDQVLMGAYSPGGLSLVADELYPSGVFAGQLIALSGLGEFDAIQLERALTGRVAMVRAVPAEFSESLSGTASPQDLETLFQLTHLTFTAPRNDSAAYESFMTRIRAALANRDANPQAAFSDTFAATIWQNHPRARPQTVEFMNDVNRNDAYRIFRDRFADAGDFTFAFVGAFDDATIRPLIETYIASLPSAGTTERPRDNGMRPVRGVVEKVVRRGIEPRAQTRITFTGPFEYTRDNRLALALLMEVVDMRLRDVLREDMGGTYGVGVSQSTQYFPEERYSISIQFGTSPDRLEELTAAVLAELEAIRENGPDPDALARVREQQRRGFETNSRRNEYWLSVLLREAETGEPSADVLQFPARVQAVTAAALHEAARRWLDLGNYVRVSLVPEAAPLEGR